MRAVRGRRPTVWEVDRDVSHSLLRLLAAKGAEDGLARATGSHALGSCFADLQGVCRRRGPARPAGAAAAGRRDARLAAASAG